MAWRCDPPGIEASPPRYRAFPYIWSASTRHTTTGSRSGSAMGWTYVSPPSLPASIKSPPGSSPPLPSCIKPLTIFGLRIRDS
jgi:hypothetical protein